MHKFLKMIVVGISTLFLILPAYGAEAPKEQGKEATEQTKGAPREQMKGLDEQVQEIKTDVLSIAAQLNQLEEKLLYPSNTQVSLFIGLAQGATQVPDSVDIQIDGREITHHLYTFKEVEALRQGGVQRIFTGNLRTGSHDLTISVKGKTPGGSDYRRTEQFKLTKEVGPRLGEVTLAGTGTESGSIAYREW